MSALPAAARVAAAALRLVSRASFPLLLVALVRATDPPITPLVLAEGLFALALVPELCARLVLAAFAAELRVEDGALHVAGRWRSVEAPLRALARARAWRLPLPSPGLALALRAGGRLSLATPDPTPLVAALGEAGVAVPPAGTPGGAFATARAACPRRWWDRWAVKIGLASLLPAALGFHAHQHIAFGGLLGEYYLMGLGAWLASALRYWAASLLYLALWAGCFRVAVESAAWLATLAAPAPAHAAGVRSAAERSAALLYYLSIPLLLALRFLA